MALLIFSKDNIIKRQSLGSYLGGRLWNIEEIFIFLAKDIIACSRLQDRSAVI